VDGGGLREVGQSPARVQLLREQVSVHPTGCRKVTGRGKGLPVGAASGAQAMSTSTLQNVAGRQARVYSKALVEKNGKPS